MYLSIKYVSALPECPPTPPVSSAIIDQDEKLDKFKTEVDTRFLKVQQEIGNVNSNMENWMKQLMERLPSKATEDPVKLEGKKVESKEAKNDEKPIPEWEFSSDGDNNDEDEHSTKMQAIPLFILLCVLNHIVA